MASEVFFTHGVFGFLGLELGLPGALEVDGVDEHEDRVEDAGGLEEVVDFPSRGPAHVCVDLPCRAFCGI